MISTRICWIKLPGTHPLKLEVGGLYATISNMFTTLEMLAAADDGRGAR